MFCIGGASDPDVLFDTERYTKGIFNAEPTQYKRGFRIEKVGTVSPQ